MKFSDQRRNLKAENLGRWVDVKLTGYDGIALKVRGFNNPDYVRERDTLRAAQAPEDRRKNIPAADFAKLLREHILLDWRGYTNDDGSPMLFDADSAEAALADEELIDFRDAVAWAADVVSRDRYASAEQNSKN